MMRYLFSVWVMVIGCILPLHTTASTDHKPSSKAGDKTGSPASAAQQKSVAKASSDKSSTPRYTDHSLAGSPLGSPILGNRLVSFPTGPGSDDDDVSRVGGYTYNHLKEVTETMAVTQTVTVAVGHPAPSIAPAASAPAPHGAEVKTAHVASVPSIHSSTTTVSTTVTAPNRAGSESTSVMHNTSAPSIHPTVTSVSSTVSTTNRSGSESASVTRTTTVTTTTSHGDDDTARRTVAATQPSHTASESSAHAALGDSSHEADDDDSAYHKNGRLARVTAYWASEGDYYTGRGMSSTGVRLHGGHCAVDPNIIPYGSIVEIAGVGRFLAVDTGTAVINRTAARESGHNSAERNAIVVDLFFESARDGERFESAAAKFTNVSWWTPRSADMLARARSLFADENWSKIQSKQL